MTTLDTNSITNAQRYLREKCPPQARPIVRSLLDLISGMSDARRHLERERDEARAQRDALQAELDAR